VGLYDRFELLELRRDDGIQTFYAREIATARPVQVHLLVRGKAEENEALLSRLEHLPDAEWRRVIDRGEWEGMRYVVTDRLAGYPGFREWLTLKSDPAARISVLDEQFRQLFENAETVADSGLRPGSSNPRPVLAGPAAFSTVAAPQTNGPPEISAEPEPAGMGSRATPRRKVPATTALLGIVFGILAAIALLALIVAAMAFRPR
jgi:hypothetical protein